MKFFQAYHFLIFLSLTATSIAVRYAKPGCSDMCGNVRIPYPFGIGSTCSVNEWYTVDCNSSTPYLPALNHLEVMGVDLSNQTVTVNTPMISDCRNPVRNSSQTKSVDLGRSPFLFSKSHNIFVFEGCGNALLMDHGNVLTGCSTSCRNDTVSDKNNCLGISCCQTTVSNYFKSYNILLTGLERQGGVGDCGSAFLVDENSYNNRSFSSQSSIALGEYMTFVPISLLWTLSDIDHEQITCCGGDSSYVDRVVNLGNGTSVDTWKCYSYEGNPYLKDGCDAPPAAVAHYAKLGCSDMCGKVRIPYPFGIGTNCSINEWYTVDCISSTPYLPALKQLEVMGVDLSNQTVTVNTPMISDCQNPVRNSSQAMSVDLDGSPFLFSKLHNKFVVEGCGIAVMMHNGSGITGCSTICHNESVTYTNNCFGIGCCQTTIPYYLKSYNINLMRLERRSGCVSAFLVDKNSYNNRSFSSQSSIAGGEYMTFVPISLPWTLSDLDFCCRVRSSIQTPDKVIVDLVNGTSVGSWKCSLPTLYHGGNPYLIDGCDGVLLSSREYYSG